MTAWHSLYLRCADRDQVRIALEKALAALGYERYDPFGLMPGKAYPQTVRLFIAPVMAGWVRVLGEPDDRLLSPLSQIAPCLQVALDGINANIETYAEGQSADPKTALIPYLRDDCSPDQLHNALQETKTAAPSAEKSTGLPLEALPEEVQTMAKGVSNRQAQRMFDRLSKQLLSKDTDQDEAARQLIHPEKPDWNSAGGRQISALMGCLTVPLTWRDPDFDTLRDAYPLHTRRQRNPKTLLLPGDAEIMAQVPDALDYHPVYAGMLLEE